MSVFRRFPPLNFIVSFANCFMSRAGMETRPCPRGKDVKICLKDVDNRLFTAYSNFFTHTQNMCYFIQSQVWQEETRGTIDKLSSTSAKVVDAMDDVSKIQEKLIENQKETLEYQRQIAANGTLLSKALETSKSTVNQILEVRNCYSLILIYIGLSFHFVDYSRNSRPPQTNSGL